MRPEFSEFSYSFALTRELMNSTTLTGTPLLPSTRDEGRLGYDLQIPISGVPVFFQFKLADYLKRSNAKYIRDGYYNTPYFRINIYKKHISNQHNILRHLANSSYLVYYVAPTFHLQDHFDNTFNSNQVISSSGFFDLSDLPTIVTDEEHHIVFLEKDTSTYYWHPDDNEMSIDFSGTHWLSAFKSFASNPSKLGISYALKLYSRILNILPSIRDEIVDFRYINQIIGRFFQYVSSIKLVSTEKDGYYAARELTNFPDIWANFDVITQEDLQLYLERRGIRANTSAIIYELTPIILQDLQTVLAVHCGVESLVIRER